MIYSTNERAELIVGRRVPAGESVISFDLPPELGYWCPVCRVPPLTDDGEYDERLDWSEYDGFLWCSVCNKDYPSALCVPLDATPDPDRPWIHAGVDAAIDTYLNAVESAVRRLQETKTVP